MRKSKETTVQAVTSTNIQEEKTMNKLTFTVEKMYRLPDAGSLKAFADIAVNDALVIRGVRVLEGKKGVFISMPQEQSRDNKWYDQVVCRSVAIYEDFSAAVMNHYQKEAA
jgi:stage V sporulation protein G